MSTPPCPHCGETHAAGAFFCPNTQQRLSGIVLPGTVIDEKYKIVGVLGTGGMAAVYRAENQKIGRAVALKLLLPEFVADPELVMRVEREARAGGAIDHPNVIAITDLGVSRDYGPYIAMELLKGKDLAATLDDHGGKLPVDRAIEVVRQVLAALEAAHEKGVVHRDLKPENIFIVPTGDDHMAVKVLDFGISKVASEQGKVSSLTRTGSVMGTPQFMAPEQAAGAKDQDARVDIYAVGVLLYELLTGEHPHSAENYNLLIDRLLNYPPISILDRDPELDPALAAIVMKAVARKPDARYPSARAMLDALAAWSGGAPLPDAREAGLKATIPVGPRAGTKPRHTGPGRELTDANAGVRPHRPSDPLAPPKDSGDPATASTVFQIRPSEPAPPRRGRGLTVFLVLLVALAGGGFALRTLRPAMWNAYARKVGLARFATASERGDTTVPGAPGETPEPHGHGSSNSGSGSSASSGSSGASGNTHGGNSAPSTSETRRETEAQHSSSERTSGHATSRRTSSRRNTRRRR